MSARIHARVLLLAVIVAVTGVVPVTTADAALATAASAPRQLSVTRTAADPHDLLVTWAPPTTSGSSALDRYLVTVQHDGTSDVSVVPVGQTSLLVPGTALSTAYKVKVASRNLEGLGSETGFTVVAPATPGVPSAMSGGRAQGDPTTVTVAWSPPLRSGFSAVTGYEVVLKRVADGTTWTRLTTDTTATWTDLDVERTYTVTVRATNHQGSGTPGSVFVGSNRPANPRAVVSVRDPQDPTRVRISWTAPVYSGIGPVTGYQIGRRPGQGATWVWGPVLSAGELMTTVQLGVSDAADLTVRSVNGNAFSYVAPPRRVVRAGDPTPVVPATPNLPVVIGTSGSSVTVNLHGSMAMRTDSIRLTLTPVVATTFRDETTVASSTQQISFGAVPDGTYLVTVRADTAGNSEVLKSGYVTIGDVGQLTASDWQVVRGSANISGGTVDIVQSGEVRVLDTRASITEDATITTTATLHGGQGYGVWVRATHHADGTDSGYVFQVDPGWGRTFIIRHYWHDQWCTTPLVAAVPFPTGFDAATAHQVQVSVHGDTFVARVDGVDRVVVPSLAAAHAASPCTWPAPHGTRVGMRSWASGSSTFVGTTLTG